MNAIPSLSTSCHGKPLIHFFTKETVNDRQLRSLDFLAAFNLDIQYITGISNRAADALSRLLKVTKPATASDVDTYSHRGDGHLVNAIAVTTPPDSTLDQEFLVEIKSAYQHDELAQFLLKGFNGRKGSRLTITATDYALAFLQHV